ncbi:hypothetical protein BDZ97DRAFT_1760176 [Flammula alnicola]|nr:hypothetical protein BDZ97DRAFT_1760176 [Flammula alnicola]
MTKSRIWSWSIGQVFCGLPLGLLKTDATIFKQKAKDHSHGPERLKAKSLLPPVVSPYHGRQSKHPDKIDDINNGIFSSKSITQPLTISSGDTECLVYLACFSTVNEGSHWDMRQTWGIQIPEWFDSELMMLRLEMTEQDMTFVVKEKIATTADKDTSKAKNSSKKSQASQDASANGGKESD